MRIDMISGLIVVLVSLFGGVLYIAAPPMSKTTYIAFNCEQLPVNRVLTWIEMESDRIDGVLVLKHTMTQCTNESFAFKMKHIYQNFTRESDWIHHYLPNDDNSANGNITTQIINILSLLLLLCASITLILYVVKKKLCNK